MKCKKCGHELTSVDLFCPVCGTRSEMSGNDSPTEPVFPKENRVYTTTQTQSQNIYPYPPPVYQEPDPGHGDGALKVLLALGVVLLIVVSSVLIFLIVGTKKGEKTVQQASVESNNSDDSTSDTIEDKKDIDIQGDSTVNTSQATTATTQAPSSSATDSSYMFADSDSRFLSGNELAPLSTYQLKIARNEIFARHGRRFDNSELQNYFNNKTWYYGSIAPDDFNNSVLNKYETANVELIRRYEKGGSVSSSSGYSGSSEGYILPQSSSSYLTYDDIAGLSATQLKRARNEIFARHGRRFDNDDLQSYFDSQSWYNGTISPSDFNDNVLSEVESYNAAFIKRYE